MGIELVVLDFDGTLTNVDEEAYAAVAGWREDVAKDLGLSAVEIEQRWSAAQAKIELDPSNYGWLMGDKIVAPAYADPFIMARVISEVIFDEAGKYMDRTQREDLLQNRFFKKNYRKAGIAFKGEADRFLTSLKCQFGTCVVTNSGTSGVINKIKHLATDHSDIPIHGDAKKYVLDFGWTDVPESIERNGFNRPLFLQRKKYWDVLSQIMAEKGFSSEQVAVVGDVSELDLILPEEMGMHIVLTPRNSTPDFEVQAVASSQRGYVARDLWEVLRHLESLQ